MCERYVKAADRGYLKMEIRRVGCLVVQNGGAKCTFYKADNLSNSVGLVGVVLSHRTSGLGLCFIVSLIWFNK
jgi:hypothetical protein